MQNDPERWKKLWLNKPWTWHAVPGSSMIELNGVNGFLLPGDVEFLFTLAVQLPSRAARYLEIGSWMGLSSIIVANGLIANANFHAQIFCVDTWKGSAEHQHLPEVSSDSLYDTFLQNIRNAQVDQLIHPIRGDSISVAKQWAEAPLDLIFIDGDHSFEGCYADIISWRPHVKPTGRLLGHDAVPSGPVERAVKQYCSESGSTMTVHTFPKSHYIWEISLTENVPPAPIS